ncbi:MAG: ATP-dependent helicase [Bacteroidales bacterium]
MPNLNQLPDISTLGSIETNFKVFAGPGAGKTTWLIKHLEKVLRNSNRLGKTGRIACITYTNVAADEIINRLNSDKSRFDISTIHSFLYRNIVKPFSYLIEYGDDNEILFNINNMDGHDEHIVQSDRLRRWIISIGELNGRNYNLYNSPENKPNVVSELSSLDYAFVGQNVDLIIRQNRGARLPKSNRELWLYKSKYWRDGIMHHEDVLYFSFLILSKSPRIIEFVRNKFPYIFIDEFQDTTELQTWIIEKICETHTKVGIVGDLAQSIYKFTGAKRADFINFKRNDIRDYKLSHNHRSTRNIIEFLNLLRPDINQTCDENKEAGIQVGVLVGTIQSAKQWFETNIPDELLYILTRKNTSISEINNQLGVVREDLLKKLYSNDFNSSRVKLIHAILVGYKFHQKGDLKNAMNEILRPLKRASGTRVMKLTLRKIAIEIIDSLKVELNRNKSLLEFYSELKQNISNLHGFEIGSAFRAGISRTFYESHSINDLLPFVKVDTKSDDLVRTIHSAKGTEFENTLIHFESIIEFRRYILNGADQIEAVEDDGRIYYVGCSRAMNRLYINIPEASQDDIELILNMNMTYELV